MFLFRRNHTKLSNFLDITEQNVVYRLTDDFQKSILLVEFFHRFLTSLELECQKLSPPSGLAVLVSGRRVSARAQPGRAPFSNYEHHTFVSKKRGVVFFRHTPIVNSIDLPVTSSKIVPPLMHNIFVILQLFPHHKPHFPHRFENLLTFAKQTL